MNKACCLFVFFLTRFTIATCAKLNVTRMLLPHSSVKLANFSLEVQDLDMNACYEWKSSSELVLLQPTKSEKETCPGSAIVSVLPMEISKRFEAVVSVSHLGKSILHCDIVVDAIDKIKLEYRSSEIYVGGPPQIIYLSAIASDGSTFNDLQRLEFEWHVLNLVKPNSEEEKETEVIKFVDYSESSYKSEVENKWRHPFVQIQARSPGSVTIKSSLKEDIYASVAAAEMDVKVISAVNISPSENVFVVLNAKVDFKIISRYGNAIDASIDFSVMNTSVATVDEKGILTALNYGKTAIVARDSYGNIFNIHVFVVLPAAMSIDLGMVENNMLHEGKRYHVAIILWDSSQNQIHISENMKINVVFPSKSFYINSSLPNGVFFVRALVPGSGIIKAELLGVEENGSIISRFELSASTKFVIYQAVQVSPSVLLLPSYYNSTEMYSIGFKATGGTGVYTWSTSNAVHSKISQQKGIANEAVVDIFSEGDFLITVTDKNSSNFQASSKVSVQPVIDIEVYPTVVEAEIGNEVFIPLGVLGFENKERKIFRVFDDCSKVNILVEVIEKHIVSYKPDAHIPPFGRGCSSLPFMCLQPGHSRINLSYKSRENILKTTVVVACHKALKPVHPVRVAVLALGSAKEVAFEGGPRSWPLYPSSHFLNLAAEIPKLVNITIVKDSFRYNKDLHVFNVVCKTIGETMLTFQIGNKESPTNPNPAQVESSVKLVCNEPHSLHLAYKEKTKKNSPVTSKTIVKVPFYGTKQFEIDIWVKDEIGRKFANISSFNIQWKVSNHSICKPVQDEGFLEHVDASASYRKVSRDFQKFQMTGELGTVIVTAKLNGYKKHKLKEEGIFIQGGEIENLSSSVELELVSLRDLYDGVYSEESNEGTCDGDSCKS